MFYVIDANTSKGEKISYCIRAESYSMDGLGHTVFSNEGVPILMVPTRLIDSIKIRTKEQAEERWKLTKLVLKAS